MIKKLLLLPLLIAAITLLTFVILVVVPQTRHSPGVTRKPSSTVAATKVEHGYVGMVLRLLNTPTLDAESLLPSDATNVQRLARDLTAVSEELKQAGNNAPPAKLDEIENSFWYPKASDTVPVVVAEVLEPSPAAAAGIQVGDRILEVGGESVNGLTLQKVVDRIRGYVGDSVTIKIQNSLQNRPVERTIVLKLVAEDDLKMGIIGIVIDQLNTPVKQIDLLMPKNASDAEVDAMEAASFYAYWGACQSARAGHKDPTNEQDKQDVIDSRLDFWSPRGSEFMPFVVAQVFPSSPAALAGVQAGDEIVAIDGVPTKGMRMNDVHLALRGGIRKGIVITVKHYASDTTDSYKERNLTMTRIDRSTLEEARPGQQPIIEATLSTLDKEINDAKIPVLVFYTNPAKTDSQRQLLVLRALMSEYAGRFEVVQVNGSLDSYEWCEDAEIGSLPTIRYFVPGKGQFGRRLTGYTSLAYLDFYMTVQINQLRAEEFKKAKEQKPYLQK